MTYNPEAATRLLTKLRHFAVETLEPDERVMLALLLAPGIQAATGTEEVAGFTFTKIGDQALVESLHEAVRRSPLRIVGLESE